VHSIHLILLIAGWKTCRYRDLSTTATPD